MTSPVMATHPSSASTEAASRLACIHGIEVSRETLFRNRGVLTHLWRTHMARLRRPP
jgi:hypothetical protein